MKQIISYIKWYFYEVDRKLLALVSLLAGILIFLNYHYHIDDAISREHFFGVHFTGRYIIYSIAFSFPYIFCSWVTAK